MRFFKKILELINWFFFPEPEKKPEPAPEPEPDVPAPVDPYIGMWDEVYLLCNPPIIVGKKHDMGSVQCWIDTGIAEVLVLNCATGDDGRLVWHPNKMQVNWRAKIRRAVDGTPRSPVLYEIPAHRRWHNRKDAKKKWRNR